jgi:hypothetical protein
VPQQPKERHGSPVGILVGRQAKFIHDSDTRLMPSSGVLQKQPGKTPAASISRYLWFTIFSIGNHAARPQCTPQAP